MNRNAAVVEYVFVICFDQTNKNTEPIIFVVVFAGLVLLLLLFVRFLCSCLMREVLSGMLLVLMYLFIMNVLCESNFAF